MIIEMENISVTEGKRKLSGIWTIEYEPSEDVRYEIDEDGNEIGYNKNGDMVSFTGVEAIEELTKLLIKELKNDN